MARDVFRCLGCKRTFLISDTFNNDGVVCASCKCPIKETNKKTVNKPLLTIELQDESSVPKVYYKGEEINFKQNVYFDWDTDTSTPGGLTYAIEHAVTDEGHAVVNRIERRVKGHAT